MREPLRVAVAQPPCVAYDVAANAAAHAGAVRAARARVVVFPELSLTGYELDAPTVDPADPALAPLVEACAATGSLALAGAPAAGETGRRHLAMLAVDGSGARAVYHKRWLHGTELEHFHPGDKPVVLTVDGWRLGLAICKDTGAPAHDADIVALGMDAYLAGVLEQIERAEIQDARAYRVATTHQVWVAVASFAGSTGGGFDRAMGRSAVWDPAGAVVARCGSEPGTLTAATLT